LPSSDPVGDGNGGAIYISTGKYQAATSAIFNGPNYTGCNIVGAGDTRTVIQPTAGTTVFTISGLLYHFRGFRIDNENNPITATGFNFNSCGEITISDIQVRDVSVGMTGSLTTGWNCFYSNKILSPITITTWTWLIIMGCAVEADLNITGGKCYIVANDFGTAEGAPMTFTWDGTHNVALVVTGNHFYTSPSIALENAASTPPGGVVISGNNFFIYPTIPPTTGTPYYWLKIGNNWSWVSATGNVVGASPGYSNLATLGSGLRNILLTDNIGYNPQPKSSSRAGRSPYTFPALPYPAIYVITTTGRMTALTLDGQALFGGVFSAGQQVYVGANHTLIATWATILPVNAPVFEILPI